MCVCVCSLLTDVCVHLDGLNEIPSMGHPHVTSFPFLNLTPPLPPPHTQIHIYYICIILYISRFIVVCEICRKKKG